MNNKNTLGGCTFLLLVILNAFIFSTNLYGQSFSQNSLNFNGNGSISNGTSLMFGPDDRLYVTEYTGAIKIFTIQRLGAGQYNVISAEILSDISTIQDHNDDGSLYSTNLRETIGLTVGGTAENPVIYVASSDFRIGGGGGGGSGDTNLDTNSGIITRFTWNGNSWDVVDIVRGLPRSEENHATNGMELATINGVNYLIVAQGGHTNAGAPSVNFAYLTEYALSAAILSINLDMINSMPLKINNGRKYIYDLPTLDDPTRLNKNGIVNPDTPGYDGIDVNDPFGGNDGLNQAKIVPGGPIQIFSPGFRNCYDLVLTQRGALYVTENGSNGGWGGFPINEGGGAVTNGYDPNELGSTVATNGEKVNNQDHLQLVTPDIQNYNFGKFYGGHPTPIRANPNGAGLYTNPSKNGTTGAIFRTKKYHPTKNNGDFTSDPNIALPADWPPVSVANLIEGDWRGPGIPNPDGPIDDIITVWGTNTNGIDEYTAGNFNGAMKGNLLAGVNTGVLRRVELKPDGSLSKLTPTFVSGLGGDALGVTCNGDSDIFPGTIWVVTLNGKLIVLEPQDFGTCIEPGNPGYDANADYDLDSYTNKDEEDNNTDPCNGGLQPNDFDKSDTGLNSSDLNDLDDDNDGILDAADVFQLGNPQTAGSDAYLLPVNNELFSSNTELGGYKGLGLTGIMNNGDANPNWLKWLDRRDDPNDPNENDILGGAIGAMTMQMTSGTALGFSNNQEKGFQYGIQVDSNSGIFTVKGGIANFNGPVQLYGTNSPSNGELGFFIGDGTQSNYIKFVITPSGLIALQELNDVVQSPINFNIPNANRPKSSVSFYFVVNPSTGEIILKYSFDAGVPLSLGSIIAKGTILQSLQDPEKDLAVGMIGTSNTMGVEVEGTWDFLHVTSAGPTISAELPDLERSIGSAAEDIDLLSYFNDNEGVGNLTFSVVGNTNSAIGVVISGSTLTIKYPGSPVVSEITIRATDADSNSIEQRFSISVIENQVADEVLYRINAGGPAITAIDGKLNWEQDTKANKSAYLSQAGMNNTYSGGMTSYNNTVNQSTTPVSIYNTERYDSGVGAPNLAYSFPVDKPGMYEVRLYMGNSYSGTAAVGKRIFDISIEGVVYSTLDDIDLSVKFGHQVGGVIIKEVEVKDGLLEIAFIHGAVENPLINGIEILGIPSGVPSTPINVLAIGDQVNFESDALDGSLVISASGGDGNLTYSMTGAPSGVNIEPTNGQIGGTINPGTAVNSPYIVTVKVDDSDGETSDAVGLSFNWEIKSGTPTISAELPDLERSIGSAAEDIDLLSYFNDNEGVGNLTFSVVGNTNSAIGVVISGSTLTIKYPGSPVVSEITIRATDADSNSIEQRFSISVIENQVADEVLYRINAGGPAITAIDGKLNWEQDTKANKSAYLSQAGMNNTYSGGMTSYNNTVNQSTTPVSIYNTERYDSGVGAPNLAYSFPVDKPGMYEVRLYMGNSYSGTAAVGKRIFDISIEGVVYSTLDDIDLSVKFGHQVGGVIIKEVEVKDGLLEIAFIHGAVENPLINGIEILGIPSGVPSTPINVLAIGDQVNFESDALDGSLVISASGGDGNLTYSMTGAPSGVNIEPTNGQIGGTINPGTAVNSPYIVTVKVDDSDGETSDAVGLSFNWEIKSGTPTISAELPDLERSIGSAAEDIDLLSYFNDNEGVGNLTFSVVGNTNSAIGVVISGSTLTIKYPGSPVVSEITIRATDADSNSIEQRFSISVIENQVADEVLYRINAGGPAITAIDGKLNWEQDTKANKSAYLSQAGMNNTYSGGMTSYNNTVNQSTTPVSIYNTERYDSGVGAPNLAYSFPVDKPGMYEVRLYMGNSYSGTAAVGKRIFDISIEGVVYSTLDDIDLSVKFGHQVGGVIIKEVEVKDGLLEIAFIHGAVENPLINGIEILGIPSGVPSTPINVLAIGDQVNFEGDALDGSLVISASGGDGNLTYSMTGAPSGVNIAPTNGQIGGTINPGTAVNSPYIVTVKVDDSDGETSDARSLSFNWEISGQVQKWIGKNESENYTGRHECSFVQAGDKFYLLGGRENAKTIDVYDYSSNTWISLDDSLPFEFNHFQATEYQGLIWVIGAFSDNGFPREVPEDFIWIFNPATKEWIKGPEIPSDRQRGSAGLVVYKDKFYIIGGNNDGHNGGAVVWFDEYDPATGTWTPLINAPRARDHFHAAIVADNLYAIGGRLSGGNGGTFKPVIPEVDVFNFTTNTWSTLPSNKNLPTPRAAASVVNFNQKLLVIGGEVENEIVYGKNINGALKVTEEYDPLKGSWKRVEDLNHQRHGTQAIVSGQGVFTLGGSPQLGGGAQKNMEYLGVDIPAGVPSIASSLIVPSSVQVSKDSDSQVTISVSDGNIGKLITSMEIAGANKENFVITSGNLLYGLLKPNSNHSVHLNFLGSTENEHADLVIYYDSGEIATVALQSTLTNTLKSATSSVVMYPNPAAYNVTIQVLDPYVIVKEIYIYNFSGILSRRFTFPNNDKSDVYNFDVSTLPSGVYIVKLKTDQNEYINLNLIVKK